MKYDICDKSLKNACINTLQAALKEALTDGQKTEEEIENEISKLLKPYMFKQILVEYSDLIKLWYFAKKDETHKKIMATKRKLIDEDEFEPIEAIEYAVKKRKYLIKKETDMVVNDEHSDIESDGDEDEDGA